jgi:CheY-like chemotaxis protein
MKCVLSVGQCAFDHGNISAALTKQFDAQVVPAATQAEALEALSKSPCDLVLVNRIFDADGSSGIEFIRALRAQTHGTVPVMLVSNFEEYQQQAVAAGAERGFGKAALTQPETLQRLGPYLK